MDVRKGMEMFILQESQRLLIYGLLVYYIGRSVWSWMKPGPSIVLKWIYIVVLTVVSTSFVSGRFFGNLTVLSVIGSYWMAIFYVLIILLPLMHIMLWSLRLTALRREGLKKAAGFIVLVLLVVVIGFGSFNAYSPTVRAYDIHVDKDAGTLEELNIVMASDMHFGVLSGKAHAVRLVKEINDLKPDLVLFLAISSMTIWMPILAKGSIRS